MNRQYGALSGVAILLIVSNHAIHFGLQVSPLQGAWLAPLIVVQALGAFAVPTFLFVSGTFVAYAATGLTFAFLRSSIERILWPYVIWSAIFYLTEFLVSGVRHSLYQHIKNLLVGYPYHFVPLLLFWYLVAPLVVRVGRRHGLWLLAGIGLYQVVLIALRFPGIFGPSAILPEWARHLEAPILFTTMADWALYFPLGLVLSMHRARARPRLLRLRWVMAGTTAGFFALGLLNAFKLVVAPWARLVAPVPLMFVLPTIERGWIPFPRAFEFLGRRSYGVYLAHFVVVSLAAALLPRAGLSGPGAAPLVFPLVVALAVGLPLALMAAMAHTAPTRRFYRYFFGIVPTPS